jgi:hypothetical protein
LVFFSFKFMCMVMDCNFTLNTGERQGIAVLN